MHMSKKLTRAALMTGVALAAATVATPAGAVVTVLNFSGNICNGGQACDNYAAIDQSHGDSALQNVSYRSFVTSTGVTSEAYLKYWSTGYGDLQGNVWGGGNQVNFTSEIVITPTAGYEVSLTSFLGGCYLNRTTCQTFPYTVSRVSGGSISGGSTSPPSGGHSTVAINSGYFADGIVLRWGPDGYDGGLDDITFDVRAVSVAPPGAVPEPATWGMLLLGFGGVGYALRRRPRAARIRFA